MASAQYPTFEELLRLAGDIPFPEIDDKRQVYWCESTQSLGISRQRGGSFEIFICGTELKASSPLVSRHLRFDRWTRNEGEVFPANRIVLPSDSHFLPVVAFLAEELLRSDVVSYPARGFAQTEPLIEMALRRVGLSEEELIGLLGELRFLEVLLTVAARPGHAVILDGWRGHQRGARDFVYGQRSVEVKATRGDRSAHRISSVMQVDPRRSSTNELLEELYLLSLGFKTEEAESAQSIQLNLPNQVDSILSKLSAVDGNSARSELQLLFLSKVSSYGSAAGKGYEHDEMRNWSAYQTAWMHGFVRIYDMADPAVQVLRREDIQRRGQVVLDSVSFDIDLPDRISGDLNPESDLFALARRLLRK